MYFPNDEAKFLVISFRNSAINDIKIMVVVVIGDCIILCDDVLYPAVCW